MRHRSPGASVRGLRRGLRRASARHVRVRALGPRPTGPPLGSRPAGDKPLFYAHVGSRFWFASEIKALLAGGLERTVDAQALRQYLTSLYVPSPRTIFEGIRQLPPGHILTLTRGELRVRRYWSLRPDPE